MEIDDVIKCSCGAYTVTSGRESYCMSREKGQELLGIDLEKLKRPVDMWSCNSCVNHWNVEFCGCGSGEKFGECDGGFEACEVPMQVLGKYSNVRVNSMFSRPSRNSLTI